MNDEMDPELRASTTWRRHARDFARTYEDPQDEKRRERHAAVNRAMAIGNEEEGE